MVDSKPIIYNTILSISIFLIVFISFLHVISTQPFSIFSIHIWNFETIFGTLLLQHPGHNVEENQDEEATHWIRRVQRNKHCRKHIFKFWIRLRLQRIGQNKSSVVIVRAWLHAFAFMLPSTSKPTKPFSYRHLCFLLSNAIHNC